MFEKKYGKTLQFVIAAVIVGVLFLLYCSYSDFIFSTNDDLIFKNIVSGELGGAPDMHLVYESVILGAVLKGLYQMWPQTPWYGMFLCFCLCISMTAVLYRILTGCEKAGSKIAAAGCFMVFGSAVLMQHFILIQFTVTAGITGAAAVFWLFTTEKNTIKEFWIANIPALLLGWLCCLIRNKVLFMFLPIAGMLALYRIIGAEWKKRLQYYGSIAASLLLGVLLITVIDRMAYTDAEWRDYMVYDEAGDAIYDYLGFPEYESNQDLYQECGISKAAYEAVSTRYMVMLESKFNAENMVKIAHRAILIEKSSTTFLGKMQTALQEFVKRNLDYADRSTNIFVYMMYVFMLLLILANRNKGALFSVLLVLVGRMAAWGYIFYEGRFPVRVTQALYFAEIAALLAIMIETKLIKESHKMLLAIGICLFVLVSVKFGWQKTEAAHGESQGRVFYSTAYTQLKEYMGEHPDKLYFLDMSSISYYTENIFERGVPKADNYILTGSWTPNIPLYKRKMSKAGLESLPEDLVDNENAYVVFLDQESTSYAYFQSFLQEYAPSYTLKQVDMLETDVGTVFHILQVVDEGA